MKHLHSYAIVAAMLVTSSAGISASPSKPPKPATPTKPVPPPAPPEDTGPTTGDFIQCIASGNSIQVCMIGRASN